MRLLIFLVLALPAFAADAKIFDIRKDAVRELLQRQDYAAALAKATSINKEWPDDQVGYQLIAAAQLGLGNYAEAEKAIQWMIDLRIGKSDGRGWLLVAQFREVIGDMDGAIDAVNLAYNRAYPTDLPLSRTILIYSAHLQRSLGKFTIADKSLKDALALDGTDETALEELAMVRMAQQKQSEAAEILKRLATLSSKPKFQYELAQATNDPRDYAAFEHAAAANLAMPNNANRELALYYAGVGHRPADAERVARLEAARRHDIFTMDALAAALWANKKNTEAQSTMKQVLMVGTRDSSILAHAKLMGVAVE